MSHLPPEIWLEISSQTCITRKNLLSLVTVNRFFHGIFARKLYANVRIDLPSMEDLAKPPSSLSRFSSAGSATQNLLDRLESDKPLRRYVHECRVKGTGRDTVFINLDDRDHYCEKFIVSLITLIGDLPNLKTIRLVRLAFHVEWMVYLASRPSLRLTIHTVNCTTYGEVAYSGPYTAVGLRALYVNGRTISCVAFRDSLQHLELPNCSAQDLLGFHASSGRPVLGSLHSLEMYNFQPDLISLFSHTPNLTNLQFRNQKPSPSIDLEGWKGIVPKLETFCGHEQLIPLFVIDHPIKSIRTSDSYGGGSHLQSLGEHFGSITPVHAITLGCSRSIEEKITYVTAKCPQVRELSIRNETHKSLTKEEIDTLLLEIANLKQLRKLSFLPTVTNESLEYGKVCCEALRAGGCKDIAHIEFGEQVWFRHPDDSSWQVLIE